MGSVWVPSLRTGATPAMLLVVVHPSAREVALATARRGTTPAYRFASEMVPVRRRWLPVNDTSQVLPESPRRGWRSVERWKERAGETPVATGCSELVRTARRGLQDAGGAGKAPPAFWRHLAKRGGRLANYLGPDEVHELLVTLADARLRWERDPAAKEGLRGFAAHVADEIGAFAPAQLVGVAGALARLRFRHEDFLQSLSRAVEGTARNDRVRLDNGSICGLLDAYRRLALLDEPVMKALSMVLCRRLVREPPTPQQTAQVVTAFADLRMRDVRLFNATTLAFTRKGVVEDLGWNELADVALSYASLRLYSESLFARVQQRVCDSAGVEEPCKAHHAAEAGKEIAVDMAELRAELVEDLPASPRIELPPQAVSRFLEVQVHLGRLSRQDLAPLLPHLAHPTSGRYSADAALVLFAVLARGSHLWPWLWRWVAPAFRHDRLLPGTLLSMLDGLQCHFSSLRPLVSDGEAWLKQQRQLRGLDNYASMAFFGHVHMLAGYLAQLWGHLGQRAHAFSDAELQQVAAIAPGLVADQRASLRALSRAMRARPAEFGVASPRRAVQHSLAVAVRHLGAELLRRQLDAPGGVDCFLELGEVRRDVVEQDLLELKLDSMHISWLPDGQGNDGLSATDAEGGLPERAKPELQQM